MKLVKLSLVAALAAGSFSALNATSLEEAIKGTDISGFAWYRFDSGSAHFYKNEQGKIDSAGIGTNRHRYKAVINLNMPVGDGFSVFGQGMFWNANIATNGKDGINARDQKLELRLAGLEYNNPDLGLKAVLGRQKLGTIWTDDMAGVAAEFFLSPAPGITVAAFAVDAFETADGDSIFASGNPQPAPTISGTKASRENLYGAAFLGNFGPVNAQVWAAHWQDVATLYAVKLGFASPMFDAKVHYLGNSVAGTSIGGGSGGYKDTLADGKLVHAIAKVKAAGADVGIAGAFYGDKNNPSINLLEEAYIGGDADTWIGKEITYQGGSWMAAPMGQTWLANLRAGYTIDGFRFGVQGVYGETKSKDYTSAASVAEQGIGKKWEAVAEANYQFNKKLDFLAYYSYLNTTTDKGTDVDDVKIQHEKNTVRFQARYKF